MTDTDLSATPAASNSPVAIPWYQSAVIQRLALSIVVQLLAYTKLSKYFVGVDLVPIVDNGLELAGIALASWAVHARATRPTPTVTLNQAQANVIKAAAAAAAPAPTQQPPSQTATPSTQTPPTQIPPTPTQTPPTDIH